MSFLEDIDKLQLLFSAQINDIKNNNSIIHYYFHLDINKRAIQLLSKYKYMSTNQIITEINYLIQNTCNCYNDKNNLSHMLLIFENKRNEECKRKNDINTQKDINKLISQAYSYICVYDLANAHKSLSNAKDLASTITYKDIDGYKEPDYFIETIEIIKNELFMSRKRYQKNIHFYEKEYNCLQRLYKHFWYKFDQRNVDVLFFEEIKNIKDLFESYGIIIMADDQRKYLNELFNNYIPSRLPSEIINKCLINTIFHDKIFQEQAIPVASIVESEIKN